MVLESGGFDPGLRSGGPKNPRLNRRVSRVHPSRTGFSRIRRRNASGRPRRDTPIATGNISVTADESAMTARLNVTWWSPPALRMRPVYRCCEISRGRLDISRGRRGRLTGRPRCWSRAARGTTAAGGRRREPGAQRA